jgi:hypothetical protein
VESTSLENLVPGGTVRGRQSEKEIVKKARPSSPVQGSGASARLSGPCLCRWSRSLPPGKRTSLEKHHLNVHGPRREVVLAHNAYAQTASGRLWRWVLWSRCVPLPHRLRV